MESTSQTVTRLISQACAQYPGGMRAVFTVIREKEGDTARSESTFYADLNANPSSQGKLKVRDLITCMEITGNHDALRFLAAHFGYSLNSMENVKPDAPTLAEEMLQDYPRLVTFHQASKTGPEMTIMATRDELIKDINETAIKAIQTQPWRQE